MCLESDSNVSIWIYSPVVSLGVKFLGIVMSACIFIALNETVL